jgi:ELWxxDGT repeat protein
VAAGRLFFYARDGVHGHELWTTDGTEAGTHLVLDIAPGLESSLPRLYSSTFLSADVLADRLVFAANDGVHGNEPWVSDGTGAGTHLVADIDPRDDDPITYASPDEITKVGDRVFFTAFDGFPSDGGHGFQLWMSDGTENGTSLVEVIEPSGAYMFGFLALADRLVFVAGTGKGLRWWTSDGTEEETMRLAGWGPEPDESGLGFGQIGDTLYVLGSGLWITDGSRGGTDWIKPVGTWSLRTVNPYGLGGTVGDRLFFSARDGVHGREPWVTDGTGRGTRLVADIA